MKCVMIVLLFATPALVDAQTAHAVRVSTPLVREPSLQLLPPALDLPAALPHRIHVFREPSAWKRFLAASGLAGERGTAGAAAWNPDFARHAVLCLVIGDLGRNLQIEAVAQSPGRVLAIRFRGHPDRRADSDAGTLLALIPLGKYHEIRYFSRGAGSGEIVVKGP